MTLFVKIEKCFLIITNIIFTVLAMMSIGFGAVLIYRTQNSDNKLFTLSSDLDFIPKTFVILGIAMVILYFIGFWGACRENLFLLQLYGAILLIILLLKGGIFVYSLMGPVEHREITSAQPTAYDIAFQNYGVPGEDLSTTFVDAVQYKFQCCGYKNPQQMNYNGTYPSTCCGLADGVCRTPLYDTGCYYKLTEFGSSIWLVAKVMYYMVLIIQVLCMTGAFHFSSTVAKKMPSKLTYYNFT